MRRGGSSGGSSTTTHIASASEFASPYHQATAQLQSISKQVGAAIEQAPHASDAQLAQEFQALAGHWQEQLSALETLSAPAALATGFNTLKDAVTRVESDLSSVVTAGLVGDAQQDGRRTGGREPRHGHRSGLL